MADKASTTPRDRKAGSFEDISLGEDGRHFIVSTKGDQISARKITLEARAGQCLGYMSEETAQQISRDLSHIATNPVTKPQPDIHGPFEARHGKGRDLGLENTSLKSSASPSDS